RFVTQLFWARRDRRNCACGAVPRINCRLEADRRGKASKGFQKKGQPKPPLMRWSSNAQVTETRKSSRRLRCRGSAPAAHDSVDRRKMILGVVALLSVPAVAQASSKSNPLCHDNTAFFNPGLQPSITIRSNRAAILIQADRHTDIAASGPADSLHARKVLSATQVDPASNTVQAASS